MSVRSRSRRGGHARAHAPAVPAHVGARAGALALVALLALAGCGSGRAKHDARAAHRLARERAQLAERRQRIEAEASDITVYSPCREWLRVTTAARDAYVAKHWPHMPQRDVEATAHDQSLGCEAAPGGPHTPMDPLQAAVYVVVLGFSPFYEEIVREGIKESVLKFEAQALGVLKAVPATAPTPPPPRRLLRRR